MSFLWVIVYPQHSPFIGICKEKVLLSLLTQLVRAGCDKNKVSFSYGASELVLQNGTLTDKQPQIWDLRHARVCVERSLNSVLWLPAKADSSTQHFPSVVCRTLVLGNVNSC